MSDPWDRGKTPLLDRVRRGMPAALIYARYILPVITALTSLVLSFLYAVKVAGSGYTYEVSAARLYGNTFTGARAYIVDSSTDAANSFYGLLVAGAIAGILIFLLAAFLAVLSAVTAIRAFRAGHESEESNRMKVIFKIAFPNRVCLFLSNLLLVVPVLYPEYFSAVGKRFLLVGGESVIFVMLNRPLIVVGVLTLVTLILAVAVTRFERQKKMNMFLVYHPQDGDTVDDDAEEYEE